MKLSGLKIEVEQAVEWLVRIGSEMGLNAVTSRMSNNSIQIAFDGGAIIRVYGTKKGTTIDPSVGKDRDTSQKIVDEFQRVYVVDRVEPGIAKYAIAAAYRQNFEKDFIRTIDDWGLTRKGQTLEPQMRLRVKVISPSNESVMVTLWETWKLVIQGHTTKLWDAVCSWVEEYIGASATDVTLRFASQLGDIKDIIASNDIIAAEEEAANMLGEAYNFLYEHDKKFVTTAVFLRGLQVSLPEYSIILLPMVKALEGYLKKCLFTYRPEWESELRARDFNWGSFFDPHTCKIYTSRCAEPQKALAFSTAYKCLHDNRNPYFHSGLPAVAIIPTREDAASRINSIASVMRATFHDIIS